MSLRSSVNSWNAASMTLVWVSAKTLAVTKRTVILVWGKVARQGGGGRHYRSAPHG